MNLPEGRGDPKSGWDFVSVYILYHVKNEFDATFLVQNIENGMFEIPRLETPCLPTEC